MIHGVASDTTSMHMVPAGSVPNARRLVDRAMIVRESSALDLGPSRRSSAGRTRRRRCARRATSDPWKRRDLSKKHRQQVEESADRR